MSLYNGRSTSPEAAGRVPATRSERPSDDPIRLLHAFAGGSADPGRLGEPGLPSASSGIPASRFRMPAPRTHMLERAHLSNALLESIAHARLVLLIAGAGYGKTTLVAQTLLAAPPDWTVSWIDVDRLDRSPVRLFRVLVDSINATHPHHAPLDADTLTQMVANSESGARAAACELAGWLAECRRARFVWVWDDVHLIDDAVTWKWVDHFIDLLPEQVCCVMTAREVPPIPLARRRAAGKVADYRQQQLRFSTDEAQAFLTRIGQASSGQLAHAWIRRSQGWIAGLRLLAAGSRESIAEAAESGGNLVPGDEKVFEYLAEEVLAKLPSDLCEFLSSCCVLDQLDPHRCMQLSGRSDALALIDQLIQRNLFVTVLDASRPTVRLHDLFRAFLVTRIRRAAPQLWRDLNLRAASIVDEPLQAVRHATQAGEPARALQLLARNAESLLRQGHADAVLQMLRALSPEGDPSSMHAHWIAGLLAWQRSAFDEARASLELAWKAFDAAGDRPFAARSLLLLARVVSYVGDIDAAAERLERIDVDGLGPDLQAELALERAWLFGATGRPEEASAALLAAIDLAERVASPELCVRLAERIRTHFVAMPRFSELFRRFHALVVALHGRSDSLVFAHATVLGAWAALWEGDLDRARALHETIWVDVERWRAFHALSIDLATLRAMLLTIDGRFADAIELIEEVARTGHTAMLASRNACVGSHLYLLARSQWGRGDTAALRNAYARLLTGISQTEWPYMAAARRWAEALIAYEDGEWQRACVTMLEVVEAQRRFPLLALSGDVRVATVDALVRCGRIGEARAMTGQLLDDAMQTGMFGRLLFGRRDLVAALVAQVAGDHPRRTAHLALIERCATLRPSVAGQAAGIDGTAVRPANPLDGELTAREREVLARIVQGASNKRIALDLGISLHTVKRHVANIIGKAGVRTRGEVVARYLGSR